MTVHANANVDGATAVLEPPPVHRERMLGISRNGTSYCVVEVHHEHTGPGDTELDWDVSAYECSGWYRSAARARERRDELERQGLWLSQWTLDRMRAGQVVPVHQLEFER